MIVRRIVSVKKEGVLARGQNIIEGVVMEAEYYDLHPIQALRGLARVKTERIAGR